MKPKISKEAYEVIRDWVEDGTYSFYSEDKNIYVSVRANVFKESLLAFLKGLLEEETELSRRVGDKK